MTKILHLAWNSVFFTYNLAQPDISQQYWHFGGGEKIGKMFLGAFFGRKLSRHFPDPLQNGVLSTKLS